MTRAPCDSTDGAAEGRGVSAQFIGAGHCNTMLLEGESQGHIIGMILDFHHSRLHFNIHMEHGQSDTDNDEGDGNDQPFN